MDINSVSAILNNKAEATENKNNANHNEKFSTYLDKENEVTLDAIFERASKEYNVDVKLLRAMAMQESCFDAKCTSRSGAMGIMQLMPGTADYLGVKDAYDPESNIMGGAKYISNLLKQYNGNVTLALAAYNAGSGNVKKYGGVPPFAETQDYVKKVTGYYEKGVTIPEGRNHAVVRDVTLYDGSAKFIAEGANAPLDSREAEGLSGTIIDTDYLPDNRMSSDELLDALSNMLSKLGDKEDKYSYEEYGRYMQLYLDKIAIDAFSDNRDSVATNNLEDTLKDIKKILEGEESDEANDLVYASKAINYSPSVLALLNGRDKK